MKKNVFKIGYSVIPFILCCLLCNTVSAQDKILMKDGSTIQAKIEKVTDSEIQFRKYGVADQDMYSINKSAVKRIDYENGEIVNLVPGAAYEVRKVVDQGDHELASAVKEKENVVDDGLRLKYNAWWGGYKLVNQGGVEVERIRSNERLRSILEGSPGLSLFNQSLSIGKVANVFYTGGVCTWLVGYILYTTEEDIVTGVTMEYIGLGLVVTALPFMIISNVKARQATNAYNQYVSGRPPVALGFGPTKNGLGLILRF
jgi:hypothetical protein